jgi:CBS-domain-containing membrane protein
MVTDRDVCMAAYTQGRPLREMRVGEVMSSKVHACRMADDLEVAERMMKSRQVRRLPVLDTDERLVGMLSLNDLALRAAREVSPDQVAGVLAAVCAHRRGAGASEPAILQAAGRAEAAERTGASRRSGGIAPVRGPR